MPVKDREAYNAYMRQYMAVRYRKRMDWAIAELGGKCISCGTTDGLQFDHIDRTTRVMCVTQVVTYSDARFKAEIAKCQLLCQPCHTEKTLKDLGTSSAKGRHGTISTYRHCKCEECKEAKRKQNRDWFRRHRAKAAGSLNVA